MPFLTVEQDGFFYLPAQSAVRTCITLCTGEHQVASRHWGHAWYHPMPALWLCPHTSALR